MESKRGGSTQAKRHNFRWVCVWASFWVFGKGKTMLNLQREVAGTNESLPFAFNNNDNNWILTGFICPTKLSSRHGTGFTYSLAMNLSLNTIMRGNVSYAVEERIFHRPQCDAGWLFLTVFIGFPHRVFPLWPDVRDLPTALRLANSKLRLPRELPTPPRFAWLCWHFPWVVRISLNSAIFCYNRANYFHPDANTVLSHGSQNS